MASLKSLILVTPSYKNFASLDSKTLQETKTWLWFTCSTDHRLDQLTCFPQSTELCLYHTAWTFLQLLTGTEHHGEAYSWPKSVLSIRKIALLQKVNVIWVHDKVFQLLSQNSECKEDQFSGLSYRQAVHNYDERDEKSFSAAPNLISTNTCTSAKWNWTGL